MIRLTTPTTNAIGPRSGWPGRASMLLFLLSLSSRLLAQAPVSLTFTYSGQIETFTVPTGVSSLTIEARGAEGGGTVGARAAAGKGAIVAAQVSVTPSQSLSVLVGQWRTGQSAGGGGTFVVGPPSSTTAPTPLVIAGAGGGAGDIYGPYSHGQLTEQGGDGGGIDGGGGLGGIEGSGGRGGASEGGGGGGGLLGDGGGPGGGKAFVHGGAGGIGTNSTGSFGGGGGFSGRGGGGGGGYSGGGGGGGDFLGVGGGGGSFTASTAIRLFAYTGYSQGNSGDGLVIIKYVLPTIRYVKQGGSGTGDGTSWNDASGDLQAMIDAPGVEQVWVAGGTYTRAGGAFRMKNGVAIYGGFSSSSPESSTAARASLNPVTGSPSSSTLTPFNSSYVVIDNTFFNNAASYLNSSAHLDGFVITGARTFTSAILGGGIRNTNSSPTLVNCLITDNRSATGGGVYNREDSSPTLTNCVISNNQGGGITNENSSNPKLVNCLISGNQGFYGGGIINTDNSRPTLINCLINGNQGSNGGGGISNQGSSPVLINCTLTANQASPGAAVYNRSGSQPQLTNCILWDNQESANTAITNDNTSSVTATFCLIGQGETDAPGQGNLTATSSPFAGGTDYRLNACALAINTGSNKAYTAVSGPTTDLGGNARVYPSGGAIDMGAYEYQAASDRLAITAQPASASSVQTGASVSVPVSVSGNAITYQWYKNSLSNPVSGQTSATLTIPSATTADAGSYSLVVTGSCNSVTTTAFSLSVNPPIYAIRYVRQNGTGDGGSWATASSDLQAMINAPGVQQVWVAGGRYTTTQNNGSFVMKENVAIYGGFRGTESSLTDRPAVNPVSGSPSSSTLTTSSRASVVRNNNNGLSRAAMLDGFVITGGNGNGSGGSGSGKKGGGIYNLSSGPSILNCSITNNTTDDDGGGIYNDNSSPSILNCSITNNTARNGGGIYNLSSGPSILNCSITTNTANNFGGGIVNAASSPSILNCSITTNTADFGGGINNIISDPSILNCLLVANRANRLGGVFYNDRSSPRLINCTLAANRAPTGAALINYNGSQPSLTNTILFDNQESVNTAINNDAGTGTGVTAIYCLIGAGETDYTSSPTNLIASSSPFVSATDAQLNPCSVAINAGDPASTTATSGATDLAGNPRVFGGRIDLGAYEYQGNAAQPVAIISQPPSASSVQTGASVSVPVSVSGNATSYQWFKDGTLLSGQISATLTIPSATTADAGSYSLVVTGSCNSVTSTAFSLSVSQPIYLIRYVTDTGRGDGSSWANASSDLQAQINAEGVQQVWVAKGKYTTTQNNGSFVMKNNVAIYGGFLGTESHLTDRPAVNPVAGSPSSSTLTVSGGSSVVRNNNGQTHTALLDGFVITGGGVGGIYNFSSSPRIINCSITNNIAGNGGGIYNNGSSPTITNCSITNNTATSGGGIHNSSSSPSITNCRITNNAATFEGGGIYNDGSSPAITNCLLLANQAIRGGGLRNFSGSPQLINCTLAANRAGVGASILNEGGGQPSLTNSILFDAQEQQNIAIINYGNSGVTANYCLIRQGEGDVTGANNLTATASPFAGPADYQLNPCSVAINAGDPASTTATSGATDLAGNPRVFGGRIDLGAYEYQGNAAQPVAITSQPPSASNVTAGASVSAVVSVSGSVTAYQWYKDNLNSPVPGQISATLTIPSATTADAGSYSLVVTGACNSLTATAFTLSVSNPVPTLAGLAANPNPVCEGAAVTFTATVGNVTGSFNYTLTNGSTRLTGMQTSSAFSQSATATSVGEQLVTLTVESGGQRTSATTSLTVNPIPNPPSLQTSASSTINRPISVTASGCAGGSIDWILQGGAGTASGNLYTLSQPGSYTLSARCRLGSCTSPAASLALTIAASGPLSLLAPNYDCTSGVITFNTQGGDGSLIEYFAIGITPWSPNPQHTVEAELREDPKKVELLARQNGLTVRYLFDLPAFCAGLPTPPQSSTNPAPVVNQAIGAQTTEQNQPYRFDIPAGTFTDPDGESLTYYALSLPMGLTLTGTTISGTPTIQGRTVVTLIAVDPTGQTANTSFLFTVTPPLPDVTPVLTTLPALQYGTTTFSVVVEVFELNGAPTQSSVTLYLAKDPQVVLRFDRDTPQLGGKPLQNGNWTFDGNSNNDFYILTCPGGVSGKGRQTVGLSGVNTPGGTKGRLTLSAMVSVSSGAERQLSNNTDADTIEYFSK